MKHNVIMDYAKHMGGVDRTDHFIASYQFMSTCVINSYLQYVAVQNSHHKKP
jgi:hypothetical protein